MQYSDIGIDLGTASVLVYIKGRGVVLCNTEKIDEFIESCWEEDDFYE